MCLCSRSRPLPFSVNPAKFRAENGGIIWSVNRCVLREGCRRHWLRRCVVRSPCVPLHKHSVLLRVVATPFISTGKAVNKIAEVLTEVRDWEGLANELSIKRGALDDIKTTCRAEAATAKCYRRELVNWYCDSTGYELGVIVENIAQALEELEHKRQAKDLRALKLNGMFTYFVCARYYR